MTAEEVNNALKQATTNNESFGYTDEEIVSSDIIGSHFGSVFDATQTEITAVGDLQLVKTVTVDVSFTKLQPFNGFHRDVQILGID